MAVRIISAVIALPILLVVIYFGGTTLKIASIIVSIIGMSEVYKAFTGKHIGIHIFGYVGGALYIYFLDNLNPDILITVQTIFMLLIFTYMVIKHKTVKIKDVLVTIFGFFYVPFLLSNIYLLRQSQNGLYFIWLVFISAWACDTGAYFVGVNFGKNKLIPELSPKKTIEGSIGGVLTATIIGFIYGVIVAKMLPSFEQFNIVLGCVIVSFVGSIFAQFGDLTASSIKRFTGIKDFGKIMPGHGGVIDRFDSVMFTAPIVYITFMLL